MKMIKIIADILLWVFSHNTKSKIFFLFANISLSSFGQNPDEKLFDTGYNCYEIGNYSKAYECFSQLAQKGHTYSEYMLANCYWEGHGIEKNEEEAFKLWMKAAEKGMAEAQHNIGWCYQKGEFVEMDFAKAVFWFEKSASQNIPESYESLAELYFESEESVKDIDKAFILIDQAIKMENRNVSFYDTKGYFYAQLGKKEKAFEIWRNILTIDPEYGRKDTRHRGGRIYLRR